MLAPLSGRNLLVGKNVAMVPLAMVLGWVTLVTVQYFSPMRWSHFVATFFQLGTMFMVSSLVGNLLSIYTPLGVKEGSMQPVNLRIGTAFLQLLIFLLAPLGMIPALAPLGLEYLLRELPGWGKLPVYLVFAAAYFLVMLKLYSRIVSWQGDLLHRRQFRILDTVTHAEG